MATPYPGNATPLAQPAQDRTAAPVVRTIALPDLHQALRLGWEDFTAIPSHAIILCLIYPVLGLVLARTVLGYSVLPLLFPLAAGFALLGPFAALGLYELSRRREAGAPIKLGDIYATLRSRTEIGWMAFVSLFIFLMWMYQVRFLMALLLGLHASFASVRELLNVVLTTNEGLLFLAVGNLDGAVLSLILFSLTVVSFPLLLERDVDFVTAMITSVRAVVTSPVSMIGWAAMIVVLLILSTLPFFLGLMITLPVLGHATWHLYRRVVAPAAAM